MQAVFSSSFSMPAAEASIPAPASADPTPLDVSEAAAEAEAEEGGDGPDWKPEYEANLARWRAEADVARANAEATRERIAAERAAEAKPGADAEAAKKKQQKEKEEAEERARRLAAALEDSSVPSSASGSRIIQPAGENKKLKEAWEHVSTPRGAPGPLASGAASAPTTSAPPSTSWEEVSAPSAPQSSDTSSDNLPSKRTTEKAFEDTTGMPVVSSASATSTNPSVPQPSLTLSIFTRPGSLTVSRVMAALGINLVLPFINGVFLGLGEIFAREAVRFGRIWWREKKSGDAEKGWTGGKGTAGVGLSAAGF